MEDEWTRVPVAPNAPLSKTPAVSASAPRTVGKARVKSEVDASPHAVLVSVARRRFDSTVVELAGQTMTVVDPFAVAPDPAVAAEISRVERKMWFRTIAAVVPSSSLWFGSLFYVGATGDNGGGMMIVFGSLFPLVLGIRAVGKAGDAVEAMEADNEPVVLVVPKSAGLAHKSLVQTPARLRALKAPEDVVVAVEEQAAYGDELVVEIARLHALGAGSSEEAEVVRDRLIEAASHAEAAVAAAGRREQVAATGALTTGLLLDRAPDTARVAEAVRVVEAETEFIRGVLGDLDTPSGEV